MWSMMKKCNVMKYEKRILILFWSVILPVMVFATNENTDTQTVDILKSHEIKNPYRFHPAQLIITRCIDWDRIYRIGK